MQFWDGRAADVEAQAKGPILNPVEMALPSEGAAVAVLESIPEYVEFFQQAFPNDPKPVTYDNIGKAIGAFERGLLTPSRWDKFLGGEEAALTAEEQAGAKKFVSAGCASCHSGALLGGHIYQRIGAAKPYPDTSDPGRFKVTKAEGDKMMFKVPSLRNIAKTAPYFHNGKVAALNEAVSQMAEYQLGRQMTAEEVGSIVKFLNVLTGDIPAQYIQKPTLPPSTRGHRRRRRGPSRVELSRLNLRSSSISCCSARRFRRRSGKYGSHPDGQDYEEWRSFRRELRIPMSGGARTIAMPANRNGRPERRQMCRS